MELRSPHSIHSRKRGGRDDSCEDAAEHQNAIGNLAGQVPFLGHDKMSSGAVSSCGNATELRPGVSAVRRWSRRRPKPDSRECGFDSDRRGQPPCEGKRRLREAACLREA